MKGRFFGLAAGLSLSVAAPLTVLTRVALAHTLGNGDPAPPIAVKRFIEGTQVTRLRSAKVALLELWATWCGPCIQTITPCFGTGEKVPGHEVRRGQHMGE
jgi:hypothetical protein